MRGEHILTLTPKYVEERMAIGKMKSYWKGIFGIDERDEFFFILSKPLMAHVIPRRAFPTAEAADDFLKAAKRYYGRLRQPPDFLDVLTAKNPTAGLSGRNGRVE